GAETDAQSHSFNWSITDPGSGIGGLSVTVTRDGTLIYTTSNVADVSGNFDFTSFGLGTYQIDISATDADNDRANDSLSASASRTVVVSDDDVTPPVITLGGSTGSQTDGENQAFTWNVTDAG